MNILRGFIAAMIWALIGAVMCVLVIAVFTYLSWQINDTNYVQRQYDIQWWQQSAFRPLLGASIFLGLTAWATYTPKKRYGFGKTLAIIFFSSVMLYALLGPLELTPRRFRSIEHPVMYPSEFLLLFLPPLIISIILIVIRYFYSRDVVADASSDQNSYDTEK